ncbi:AF4/FMR2 family member 1 isoform X1 [Oncorhynchus tshawytscha]|uniref:AF4/FMR2 family member 1 isoform X1 n=1 Tax=Oncorhynchus tshawytscha TaxID=74940 RepID=UPI000D0A49D0|nr:AF4/FMR2 family member 1 isoform X1 [Oncorhynchus tshawytscha]
MAARSSHNEERNLLRIREWERRNQEAFQEKEFYQENVPLFGEPYKTNKGDELSSRIQRMLGSYEDVNISNSHLCLDSSFSNDPPSHVTTTYRRPSHSRDRVKPAFQNTPLYGAGPNGSGGPSISRQTSQPLKRLPVPSSHTQSSLGLSQGRASPDPLQGKAEPCPWPDLRECASLTPVLSTLSPPAEPLSPLHSSDPSDSEPQDTPDRHQGSPLHTERHPASLLHPDSPVPMEGSSLDDPQRDIPLLGTEGATTLPSQTFPLPLASKPNLVMPQKPTAYVRPMDGQDQVTSESPDLKPSPEGFHGQSYHEPLPDLKSTKPSLSKLKIPSQSIETLSNKAHCVEDILREMTHSWPPLLTAIHTPSTAEPSKFSFPVKEAQHVPPAFPGQKQYGSPPLASSSRLICQQSSSSFSTVVATHSSGVESASSSDSESSSGSDSDSESSESGTEEAPQPIRSSSPPVPKAEGPVVTNWQLNNWIRVSQQNPITESHSDTVQSPLPKQQQSHDSEEEAIPPRDYKSHTPPQYPEFSDSEAKPPGSENVACKQHVRHKSPAVSHVGDSSSQRKTVGNKHPSRPVKAPRTEDSQAGLRVESVEVAPRDKDPSFTDRPKVKTKTGHSSKSGSAITGSKKPAKRNSLEKRKTKKPESGSSGSKMTLMLDCKRERSRSPSPARVVETSVSVRKETVTAPHKGQKTPRSYSAAAAHQAKRESSAKASRAPQGPPHALLVKIELNLLSRVPPQGSRPSHGGREPTSRKRPNIAPERGDGDPASPITTKVCKKRPAEKDAKSLPRKKPKLEKDPKHSSSCPGSGKSATPKNPGEEEVERKRSKKGASVPLQDPGKEPGRRKRHAGETPEPNAASAAKSKDREASTPVKHKKGTGKRHTEHSKTGKAPKSSFAFSVPAQLTGGSLSSRPLLKVEDRQHPVEYHMKEAKKLKHKADATSDKVGKAFNYLDAAMSFVESGIAMETDPQTPKSAYTMFAETLDLIRFILKLKGSMDPSAPVTDKDFTILCMRCQSLLQMAMFRYKRETALKYSRTLTDHFKSSSKSAGPSQCVSKSTGTPSPMSPMPSPASTASSGPGSNHSSGVGMGNLNTVAIPQVIQQVASSYVNITALFLSAHDIWEKADELAHRGSGLLSELDSALGQLSLTSTMSSLVRHTRQGLQWLRLDTCETQ